MDPTGPSGAPLGARPGLGTSRALKSAAGAQDLRFWNSSTQRPGGGNGGKKGGSEPTSTRAGGQDDGSYTNSLKLINSHFGVWGGGGGGVGTIPIPDPVSDILINSNQYLLSHIFWGIGGVGIILINPYIGV